MKTREATILSTTDCELVSNVVSLSVEDTDDVISSTVSFACAAWWDAAIASAHDVAHVDLQPQY
jgi:hypothetical protein